MVLQFGDKMSSLAILAVGQPLILKVGYAILSSYSSSLMHFNSFDSMRVGEQGEVTGSTVLTLPCFRQQNISIAYPGCVTEFQRSRGSYDKQDFESQLNVS